VASGTCFTSPASPWTAAGCQHHDGLLLVESGGGEEGRPVERRSARSELGALPGRGVPHLERLGAGRVRPRDAGLELDDPGGLSLRAWTPASSSTFAT
jgi:hypothetical protein